MANYKCKKCNCIDKEGEWNKATKEHLDDNEIMVIRDGMKDTAYGCSYLCPNCGRYVNIEFIEEVFS